MEAQLETVQRRHATEQTAASAARAAAPLGPVAPATVQALKRPVRSISISVHYKWSLGIAAEQPGRQGTPGCGLRRAGGQASKRQGERWQNVPVWQRRTMQFKSQLAARVLPHSIDFLGLLCQIQWQFEFNFQLVSRPDLVGGVPVPRPPAPIAWYCLVFCSKSVLAASLHAQLCFISWKFG